VGTTHKEATHKDDRERREREREEREKILLPNLSGSRGTSAEKKRLCDRRNLMKEKKKEKEK
jgi:hypothetical protein